MKKTKNNEWTIQFPPLGHPLAKNIPDHLFLAADVQSGEVGLFTEKEHEILMDIYKIAKMNIFKKK